jgi:LacI family fructose operon transcriptional repressor
VKPGELFLCPRVEAEASNPLGGLQYALDAHIPLAERGGGEHEPAEAGPLAARVNAGGAAALLQQLLEQGYTRLVGLFGEMSVTGRERQRGFERALREHGLAPLQMRFLPPYILAGYEATRTVLQAQPRPDAILATNSLLLAGALKAIREAGLPIPEAIGLAGFDETTWTPLVEPPLTVIAQPTYEIGRMAMRMLLERLENPDLPYRQVILKGQLLVRRSTQRRPEV